MAKQKRRSWEPSLPEFTKWLGGREHLLQPALRPTPQLKVLVFLALEESPEPLTYKELHKSILAHGVIKTGKVSLAALRLAIMQLRDKLDREGHRVELQTADVGKFRLKPRGAGIRTRGGLNDRIVVIEDPPAVVAGEIAKTLVQQTHLPFKALYFLERSAWLWDVFSGREAEIRAPYEAGALQTLGIAERLAGKATASQDHGVLCVVGLAPGEGIGEIRILKRLLKLAIKPKIHYLAIDSSPRLLRGHMGLVAQEFTGELESGTLLCAGVVADVFAGLIDAVNRARSEFRAREGVEKGAEFLPNSATLVTYLGNCLGNEVLLDGESRFFSLVCSSLPNRSLELLVGVSAIRGQFTLTAEGINALDEDNFPRGLVSKLKSLENKTIEGQREFLVEIASAIDPEVLSPDQQAALLKHADKKWTRDEYKRDWDEFLVSTPRHLLQGHLMFSDRPPDCKTPPEFVLNESIKRERCPDVSPEFYRASNIEVQRYKFDYRLAFSLAFGSKESSTRISQPKGSRLTLYNITKYNVPTLVEGIKQAGVFRNVAYVPDYHQPVSTENGVREYVCGLCTAYLGGPRGTRMTRYSLVCPCQPRFRVRRGDGTGKGNRRADRDGVRGGLTSRIFRRFGNRAGLPPIHSAPMGSALGSLVRPRSRPSLDCSAWLVRGQCP